MPYNETDTISKNIQLLLDSRGMSAMDLAREIKISPSTLTNLKKGRNISIEKLALIAGFFGYAPWVLVFPGLNADISQDQYDEIMSAFVNSNLNDNSRGSVIAYCRFQAEQ